MLTSSDYRGFNDKIGEGLLDDTINWIGKNIDIFEVYNKENIKDLFRFVDDIEDLIDRKYLEKWAEDNGYKLEIELT